MDLDEHLAALTLPEPAVDTAAALDRTLGRGRARRRTRRLVAGTGGVAVLAAVVGAVVLAGNDGDGETGLAAGASSTTTTPAGAVPQAEPDPGDDAVWFIDTDDPPSAGASSFTALVTRLGCAGGVTGEVLRPGVLLADDEVTVTFTVAPLPQDQVDTCQGNDAVPVTVELGEPLGDRYLVDGACTIRQVGTSMCGPELDPVRYRSDGCSASEGSPLDVATEPDWRRHADYAEWTNLGGCLVRIDVLAERPNPDHCGWESSRVLITGNPIGERYTGLDDSLHFVRDPEGVLGDPALVAGFSADAELPDGSLDTGFRQGQRELWINPADTSAVWIVSPAGAERWPAGTPPICN